MKSRGCVVGSEGKIETPCLRRFFNDKADLQQTSERNRLVPLMAGDD